MKTITCSIKMLNKYYKQLKERILWTILNTWQTNSWDVQE